MKMVPTEHESKVCAALQIQNIVFPCDTTAHVEPCPPLH
jgi:hypothetical protein